MVDSTPPPEQATNRRSQSNATNREGSDERQNEIEQADASHTGPGSDEKCDMSCIRKEEVQQHLACHASDNLKNISLDKAV
ncbi:unnamed protein product [Clavelina lepadiformis]|uniref:Uncharacterized protein n=1 Tax=Clavelina lepadiformis TaxID=159417 RepID=A0ABP0FYN4_CLALP